MSSPAPKFDVNILPDGYRGRRLTPRHVLLILALVIIVALMVPVYQAVSGVIDEISVLKSERAALLDRAELRKEEANEKAEKVSLTKEYQIISDKRGVVVEDLEAITRSADGLLINIMSVLHSGEGETISVDCEVPGEPSYEEYGKALDDFSGALLQTGRFASAEYDPLPSQLPASVTIDIEFAEE